MAFDGVVHLLIVEEAENRRQIRENRILQRTLRDNSNPFTLHERMFLKMFRINKYCCEQLIYLLTPHLNQPNRITRIPVHLRILIALHFFDQGSYQTSIAHGYCFATSQPVVSRCVKEVSDAIVLYLMPNWIKFPVTDAERHIVKGGFRELDNRFKDAIGVVDGTFIRIIAPPENHPVYPGLPYYCRKHYYAINTQIIGDSNKKILSINARFPGSVHDSAIWMLSGVKRILRQAYLERRSVEYLIGDSGYPLEPWLLVPYVDPAINSPESRFNSAFSSLRIIIEHINGMLKSRFRCLHGHRTLNYKPDRAAKIIYSCAVLHNMCRTFIAPIPQDEMELAQPPILNNNIHVANDGELYNEGARRRNQITQRFFLN